jgi:two-component system LytT family response regulator
MAGIALTYNYEGMNCVIIDDEPRAIAVLARYVEKTEGLNLMASFDRPTEALAFLQANRPDCVFLDIQMPDLNGLQLSSLLKNVPVIFTTAYPEYALESYEASATDYLLKPIALHRFLRAVDKVRGQKTEKPVPEEEFVLLKSGSKTHRVLIAEIDYLETLGNNVLFHTLNQVIQSRLTISQLSAILPMERFLQVHKSFIVANSRIAVLESHQVTTKNKATLPIGARYRRGLKEFFG